MIPESLAELIALPTAVIRASFAEELRRGFQSDGYNVSEIGSILHIEPKEAKYVSWTRARHELRNGGELTLVRKTGVLVPTNPRLGIMDRSQRVPMFWGSLSGVLYERAGGEGYRTTFMFSSVSDIIGRKR